MKMDRWLSAILAFGIFSIAASGQQNAAPASKPTGNGPPLAETMQLIQKELNAVGKLSFVVHISDKVEGNGTSQYIEEISKVVADPDRCVIRYHRWRSVHGEVVYDEDDSLSLRDVLGLSMLTNDQHEKLLFEREKATPDEKQTLHMKFDPQIFYVIMRTDGDNEEGFGFVDHKTAVRVAKAMAHAVELCGGKNEPF